EGRVVGVFRGGQVVALPVVVAVGGNAEIALVGVDGKAVGPALVEGAGAGGGPAGPDHVRAGGHAVVGVGRLEGGGDHADQHDRQGQHDDQFQKCIAGTLRCHTRPLPLGPAPKRRAPEPADAILVPGAGPVADHAVLVAGVGAVGVDVRLALSDVVRALRVVV